MNPRALFCLALIGLLSPSCSEEPARSGGDLTAPGADVGALEQGSGADSAPVGDLPPPGVDLPLPADGGADDAKPEPDTKAKPDAKPKPDSKPPPSTELLLFDKDNLQFTAADKGFHPLIKPGDPIPAKNWLSPVDYFNGEFRIRYIIKSPADQQAGKLQTCIWTMGNGDGDGKNYFPESCSSQVAHTGVGTYENTSLAPAKWWKKSGVPLDFTHPEWFLIRVVLRGSSGCNVTTYSVSGACWNEWPKYQNMKFRVTIVMVPKGKTFSGWNSYP